MWFSASIVLGRLYPEAIQQFSVDPNTYAQEQPYIANNISMTRLAFGLDQWASRSYGGAAPLTEAAIQSEEDTFTNARLWDYRPLQTTLDQLQAVRQYYDFHDVDTDRYLIDGTLRQVMLSGRELAIDKDPDAPNWVNQRVIKTHGIGVAMVPVNEVTPEGQPRLWIRDLPPTSNSGAPEITQPRIYFGESDSHYVVVRANQQEFDYPANSNTGQGDPTTSWTGQTGIPIDSTLSRLLFSIRFRDFDLLISNQVQAGSQLLFHRTISERLGMVAPFLRFDKDPYLVVVDGKLVYVQDAYTLSDKFPNANSFDTSQLSVGGTASGLGSEDINYIRNSVKITIDAYDGTMHFYVADPTEPLIRAWQGIFPQLFEPLSKMPAELQAHLRVPEELFNVQTRMYGQYHVTQPVTFFNNTDRWTVPTEQTNQQSLPPEAYYVVMRMPGEPKAEFLLLQPMIARSRPNMIAWVAARNDAPNYGEVRAYQFPADTTIFGPPDRGADRPGPDDQRADLALEPERQRGHPGQPDRGSGRRFADLPPARLPPVHVLGVPRVPADRGREPDDRGLGPNPGRGPEPAACRPGGRTRHLTEPRSDAHPGSEPRPDRRRRRSRRCRRVVDCRPT